MRSLLLGAALASLLGSCSSLDSDAADPMRAHEPSLAVGSGGNFVAWHGGRTEGSSIYVQQLDGHDGLSGKPFAVSDGQRWAYEPDVIQVPNGLVVAWYEKESTTNALSAWLAGVARDGREQWRVALASGDTWARNPVVRQVGDHLSVAWLEQAAVDDQSNSASIWQQSVSLAGIPIGEPRKVGAANRNTWNLNATVDRDRLVVAFDAALDTRAHELHMLVIGADEAIHQVLSEDDGHASVYPDLQINASGHAALTWFDDRDGNEEVYLLAVPFTQLGTGKLVGAIRVSTSEANTIGAYVAWHGETIGLVWNDGLAGRRNIFGRAFDVGGQPLGPVRRLSASKLNAGVPAIRASGSDFLVAWNDYVIENGAASHMSIETSTLQLARLPIND